MRLPVGVEDGSSVPAEERNLIGSSATLAEGNDGKCASSTGFPVDCDVFGVGLWAVSSWFVWSRARQADLDQVGVPCVLRDAQVVIALLLFNN